MHHLTIESSPNLQQQIFRNSNHYSYFQNLELKLISQSQKLTQFMGKSLINQKTTHKFKNNILQNNINQHQNIINNNTIISIPHVNTPKNIFKNIDRFHPERIKQICQKLKQSKIAKQQRKKSIEKVDSLQKKLKNQKIQIKIHGPKPNIPRFVHHLQNLSKNTLGSKQTISLKDTVSTQSGTSFKIIDDLKESMHSNIKLNDFQIIRHLSQNQFGQVYLVKHKITHFICALKRIKNFLQCKDQQLITQRIREIKIQSFLDHPNIVQLYSIFVEGNDLYLLMELCFNGDLYNNLKLEGRFDQDKIKSVIKQICYAIQYMHDNDILHRDIKPQNILFHENITKICDFGCSVYSPLLRDTVCGTPLYSSPQIIQKQNYDNKVDIWNIGVLTFELVYGKPPYDIRSSQDLQQIICGEINFSRTKPATPEIKDFILRCLQKNPKERFNVIKLLDHQFLSQK